MTDTGHDDRHWLEHTGRWMVRMAKIGLVGFAAWLIVTQAVTGLSGRFKGVPGNLEFWVPLGGLALLALGWAAANRGADLRRGTAPAPGSALKEHGVSAIIIGFAIQAGIMLWNGLCISLAWSAGNVDEAPANLIDWWWIVPGIAFVVTGKLLYNLGRRRSPESSADSATATPTHSQA